MNWSAATASSLSLSWISANGSRPCSNGHAKATACSFLRVQDKACIDQNNINQALACLPVFLSGCQTLLIVAGPTYCSRLWCVMEIFTFMRMGGAMERIELRLFSNPDQGGARRGSGAGGAGGRRRPARAVERTTKTA